MLSKNNKKLSNKQHANQHQHFGIRKLTVGVASVLLGATFFLGSAEADTVSQSSSSTSSPEETSQNQQSSQESSRSVVLRSSQTSQKTASSASQDSASSTAASSSSSQAAQASSQEQASSQAVSTSSSSAATSAEKTVSSQDSASSSSSAASSVSAASSSSSQELAQNASSEAKQDKNTQTLNVSQLKGYSLSARSLGASLAENETDLGSISDDSSDSSTITLSHGSHVDRGITIHLNVKKGATYTISVPYLFSPKISGVSANKQTSAVSAAQLAADGFQTSKTYSSTSYTFTANTTQQLNLALKLTQTINDVSFLKPGTNFQVTVTENDPNNPNSQAKIALTYTISQPAKITTIVNKLDQNQTAANGLVQNQEYQVGIMLQNDGLNDDDNFAGTMTVNVPQGFLLDASKAYGFQSMNANGNVGDTINDFNSLLTNDGITMTQAGGAGTPITITFNLKKQADGMYVTSLGTRMIVFWGKYTQPISAADNNFFTNVTYYSTNGAEREIGSQIASHNYNANIAVGTTEHDDYAADNLVPLFGGHREDVFRDKVTNGQKLSEENNGLQFYNTLRNSVSQTRKVYYLNKGNTAHDVTFHVNVATGTEFMRSRTVGANGQVIDHGYIINVTSSNNNAISKIVLTLTDGKQVTVLAKDLKQDAAVNTNGWILGLSSLTSQGVNADGTNIKAFDVDMDTVQPGSKVQVEFMNNTFLPTDSSQQYADYSATVSGSGISDSPKQILTWHLKIVDPVSDKVWAASTVTGGNNTPKWNNEPFLTKSGDTEYIQYVLQTGGVPDAVAGKQQYLIMIPTGFELAHDYSTLKLVNTSVRLTYQAGNKVWSTYQVIDSNKYSLENLGYVGPNGEQMLLLTLNDTTPGWKQPLSLMDGTYQPSTNGDQFNNPVELKVKKDAVGYHAYGANVDGGRNLTLIMTVDNGNYEAMPGNTGAGYQLKTLNLGGKTYKVWLDQNYTSTTPEEVSYYFKQANAFGPANQIRGGADTDASYKDPYSQVDDNGQETSIDENNVVQLNYYNNNGKDVNGQAPADSTGSLQMLTDLTDKGTSKIAYNVINVPNHIQLTGGDSVQMFQSATKTGSTTNNAKGTLLFGTKQISQAVLNGLNLNDANALKSFEQEYGLVDASHVSDWSKIKSVVLKTENLAPDAMVSAKVYYRVTGMDDGQAQEDVVFQNFFYGQTSVPYHVAYNLKARISRYVQVSPEYIKQDANGGQVISDSFTSSQTPYYIKSGSQIALDDDASTRYTDGYTYAGVQIAPQTAFDLKNLQPTSSPNLTAGADNVILAYIYKSTVNAQLKFYDDTAKKYVSIPDGSGTKDTWTASGESGAAIDLTGVQAALKKLEDEGYVYVKTTAGENGADQNISAANFKDNGFGNYVQGQNGDFVVHLVHGTRPIEPSDNITTTKDVTETIHYTGAGDQTPADKTVTLHFTATGLVDKVTGEQVGDLTWTLANGTEDSGSFAAVAGQPIKHYHVTSIKGADGTSYDDGHGNIKQVDGINHNSNNLDITVTYAANGTRPIQPSDHITTTKDVTETIHYTGAGDQTPADKTVTLHFTATGLVDKVTGEQVGDLTWTLANGTEDSGSFAAVAGQPIKHYHVTSIKGADGTSYDDGNGNIKQIDGITHNSNNLDITVTYAANGTRPIEPSDHITTTKDVTETIHYTGAGDQTPADKTVTLHFTATGLVDKVTGEQVGDLTWTLANGTEDSGSFAAINVPTVSRYHVTSIKGADGTSYDDGNGNIKAVDGINHNSNNLDVTVTYTANGTKSADNGASATRTQTVSFVDENGNKLADSDVQQLNFTKGADVLDAYTGDVITAGQWSPAQTYKQVNAKVINGYVLKAGQPLTLGGAKTEHNDSDVNLQFVYVKVGRIVPVETDGKTPIPGSNQPAYVNDPNDPRKVEPNEAIPAVDGYTVAGSNVPGVSADGKTVTPVDPSKDTLVVFNKNQQPEKPNKPSKPSEPETPNRPTTPDKPVTPTTPTTPSKPTVPGNQPQNNGNQNQGNQPNQPASPAQKPAVPTAKKSGKKQKNAKGNQADSNREKMLEKQRAARLAAQKAAARARATREAQSKTAEASAKAAESAQNSTVAAGKLNAKAGQTAQSKASKNEKKLPQTGDQQSNAGLIGLMLAAVAGFLGLAGDRRKRKD